MPAPIRPPDLLLPLAHNQHRWLVSENIADLLYLAGWLGDALRHNARDGADPATRIQIERWTDEAGTELRALPYYLSNDALLRAEDEWNAEQDPAAQAREDRADMARRQRAEEMAL